MNTYPVIKKAEKKENSSIEHKHRYSVEAGYIFTYGEGPKTIRKTVSFCSCARFKEEVTQL